MLHGNRKSKITFERQKKPKILKPEPHQTGVKESNDYFTFVATRLLAAEIVFAPPSASRKALVTSKRYKIDGKCQQNTITNGGHSID
jgi:hypothetical protein